MPTLLLSVLLALPPSDVTALQDVRVVTLGPAGVIEHGTVLVAGERILAVGRAADVDVPDDARRIDGHGFTLVPGLVDLHVHVGDEVDLDLYVAFGVTTVRDLNGSLWTLTQKERIASGRRLGPTLHVSGPTITGVSDPDEADALVADQVARGYEWLKLYGDISAEAYVALVAAAREQGIRPCGHVPRNLALEEVLAASPDSIDHAEELLYGWFDRGRGRQSIPELTEWMRQSKTAVVATLTCYDTIGRQVASFARAFDRGEVRYASAYNWRNWSAERNRYARFERSAVLDLRAALVLQREFLAAFHAAGVPILLGTDSGSEGVPFVVAGASAHDELVQLTRCGLSPEQALAAGTREAARFLGVLDEVGTIEAGKRADLLLVAGDPLEDIANTALRAGVMVAGRWLPAAEIDALLESIAAQSRREQAFIAALESGGVEAALAHYEEAVAAQPGTIPFREDSLNELAYELLILEHDALRAAALFRLNTRAYPDSWNTWDSLGEALRALGRPQEALACYERAVALEPRHVDGKRCADELRAELAGAAGR